MATEDQFIPNYYRVEKMVEDKYLVREAGKII